jgi:hypothetical protein
MYGVCSADSGGGCWWGRRRLGGRGRPGGGRGDGGGRGRNGEAVAGRAAWGDSGRKAGNPKRTATREGQRHRGSGPGRAVAETVEHAPPPRVVVDVGRARWLVQPIVHRRLVGGGPARGTPVDGSPGQWWLGWSRTRSATARPSRQQSDPQRLCRRENGQARLVQSQPDQSQPGRRQAGRSRRLD